MVFKGGVIMGQVESLEPFTYSDTNSEDAEKIKDRRSYHGSSGVT